MAKVFFLYSHIDEALRDQLERQLAILKRQGLIETWHDRRIGAGQELDPAISTHMADADVILLLVSPDFLASDYCYDREMKFALERHNDGSAVVIPVILRPCLWHDAPFGKLLATPTDGRPVTQWPNIDQGFLMVATAIQQAVKRIAPPAQAMEKRATPARRPAIAETAPRSSNLRVAKNFTDRDKDRFKHDTFEYIARYFENSLLELEARHPGIETAFRRVDSNRFFVAIYKNGKEAAKYTIFAGSERFLGGISLVHGETSASNSYNDSMTVEADDQMLFMRSMGFHFAGGERDAKLTQEGAAEHYWSTVIAGLQ